MSTFARDTHVTT